MNDFNETKGASSPFRLYQCSEGCFHLIWGYVALHFTPSQFAFFVKAFQKALQQMPQELREEEVNAIHAPNELIM